MKNQIVLKAAVIVVPLLIAAFATFSEQRKENQLNDQITGSIQKVEVAGQSN